MQRFRSNLVANLAGTAWVAVLQIACLPWYIRLLGVEAYGLIGFYITIQVSLQVLDLGFSLTVNRELARHAADPGDAGQLRTVVRTLELTYWALGVCIGAAWFLLAPALGTKWIHASTLADADVVRVLRIMALLIVLQWPLTFYQNGLNGLQQQVRLNLVRFVSSTIAYGGAVAVLVTVAAKIEVFFAWQLIAGFVQIVVLAAVFWNSMPRSDAPSRFDPAAFATVRDFAGGMGAITVLGVALQQMDKIVLSKLLSLETFGYYILGGVVASALQLFITPTFSAVFPRLAGMVAKGETAQIRVLYHQGTQLMAVLLLPTAAVLVMFAPQVIQLWTGNAELAMRAAPIARLLVTGTVINGLMNLPYALQLSYGWTSLSVRFAVVKLVVFLPLLIWAATRYGAVGAAATWVALNACYMLIGVPLTHRRLLTSDAGRWFFADVGRPLLSIIAVVAAYRWLCGASATGVVAAIQVIGAWTIAFAAALLAAAEIRGAALKSLSGRLAARA
jgi:O-antigen/teichoic acid export membrane protein